jgi:hypothetical protein
MEVIYRAIDGTEFKTEQACREYELRFVSGVKMWNRDGLSVTHPSYGVVIYLDGKDAAKGFRALCDFYNDSYGGISEGDEGLFYWDDGLDEYRWIDEEIFKPLLVGASVAFPQFFSNVAE